MFKRLLLGLGLISAPAPVRSYLKASSFIGTIPALAFVAWRYRGQLRSFLARSRARVEHRPLPSTVQPASATV